MAKKQPKRRVPEILWRLFGTRARSLVDTIVSLVPPAPSKCLCKGRMCLRCSDPASVSFLLRPNDPTDYENLLTCCFVVVSGTAPAIDVYSPHSRWSQLQIVTKTIEMMMYEQPLSSNVLLSGYLKDHPSTAIMQLLSTSAWSLLLKRAGDGLMVFLLKHTSIFLPLPFGKHYQVSGLPINNLHHNNLKQISGPECQQHSLFQHASPREKRVDEVSSDSKRKGGGNCVGSLSVACNTTFKWQRMSRHCKEKQRQGCLSVLPIQTVINESAYHQGDLHQEPLQSTNPIVKPRKRSREFKWQRCRKYRRVNKEGTSAQTPPSTPIDRDNQNWSLHCVSDTSSNHHQEKMQQQCPCCSLLVAACKITKGAQINNRVMFYKSECAASVFPRNHILMSLKSNHEGANILMRDIFGLCDVNVGSKLMLCFHQSANCNNGSPCLYHSLAKLLKILIRRAQHCRYLKLLDKHCHFPPPDQINDETNCSNLKGYKLEAGMFGKGHAGFRPQGDLQMQSTCDFHANYRKNPDVTSNNLLELVKSHCSKSQVVSFIWAALRSIVPPDFLGTAANWRVLRKNIYNFICTRRFEIFSLRRCMHKLKISRFPFLSNKQSSCLLSNTFCPLKLTLLENWIYWLFSCLVVPLVQANFYVTESEHGKQEVFFYRNVIWKQLTNRVIACLEDRSFQCLNDESVQSIVSKRRFGFSKLRFCPKQNGVRALANLRAPSRMLTKESILRDQYCSLHRIARPSSGRVASYHFKSVNSILLDLHAVLKGLQVKESEKLGSSVFGYNDVYRRLCPFLVSLKNGSAVMPRVYIVVSDVVKAFDSIDQDKLLSAMKNVILENEYSLKQTHQVVCSKKSLWVHEHLMLTNYSSPHSSVKSTSCIRFPSLHTVIVDQERSKKAKKGDLDFNLTEHVKGNVLQFRNKFYLQGMGIPQGSILSSLLCSFYYGDLDRNVIYPFLQKACGSTLKDSSASCRDSSMPHKSSGDSKFLPSPKYILLRYIDDFLFLSTSKKQAASFFTRLRRGFYEYNCYMNDEKFGINFDDDHISSVPLKRMYMGEDGISFIQWSGLLINCGTLEVQADYSRYLKNHLCSTLTIRWQGKPGRQLREKLCAFLRPKCHPIFYDSNINSQAIVRLNIYQMFLLCAMKFHCYAREISSVCKLHFTYYSAAIEKSVGYMHMLIKKRMHSVQNACNFRPTLQLDKKEVEWLGLSAYIRVLKRKQCRHKELLSLLKYKLSALATGDVPSHLKYAVDDSHSSLFWKIKY